MLITSPVCDLYSESLLSSLHFPSVSNKFRNGVSLKTPGEGLLVRPLRRGDFNLGLPSLLQQLTTVGDITQAQFNAQFDLMQSNGQYFITVVEDTTLHRIAASASLVVEYKFIHNCALRGRIEDVVVNKEYRGKQLGKLLVETLTLLAKELKCYKVSLDCKDHLIGFYAKAGYHKDIGNNFMIQRFSD